MTEKVELEPILQTIRNVQPELRERYHADIVGLFGSIVRGDQTASSDIDILVDLGQDAGLFDLVELSIFMEELLKRKVDAVPADSLRSELRETVMASIHPL
ncbi:MAG: nucleotidyltransferase family protein [Caldilineaceae bacterium]|nr:nucleotidyltransferase family protein [Caldilineaceae bacterium]